ncbi:hypothetical protein O6P43_022312 [Quillaja saponaria]|uniref:Uncharacterized protein n=1 Tax=Quillaja saponaria TaxID=32244 RepID=A0AAD7LCU7_QUISA|nr:hypothetical protein O6P43_022312 [Quillaja saponaria]
MADDNHTNARFLHEAEKDYEETEILEEALSLCDLPLNDTNETIKHNNLNDLSSQHSRRSSSESTEFFEFFSDLSSEMYTPADDIIFCGKLFVPSKDGSPNSLNPLTHQKPTKHDNKPTSFRRRSESLSKLQSSSVTRSNSVNTVTASNYHLMRSSKSLDYRKLHRSSSSVISPAPKIERNSSVKSVGKSEKKASKPRWFFLMFGLVKVPSEMELSDIKNRQVRRTPSTTMFPITESGGKLQVSGDSGKMTWKILRALSCKDHTNVAVTTPFVMPQAS